MNYYQKTIFIPKVNKKGEIIGRVERWQAHRQSILHRGFTIIVFFKKTVICQHRRHPVFNGYLDFTASSHPTYKNGFLETDEKAIINTLKREWNIKKEDLVTPIKLEKIIFYKGSDGQYTEHEQCYFYSTRINQKPSFNNQFAYGYSLLTLSQIKSFSPLRSIKAPWVKKFFNKE